MPIAAYCYFTNSEGEAIEGSVAKEGREGSCEIMEFDHNVRIPMDAQTGDLTGVRQHRPAVLTKQYDKASPLLYDALCNGESLQEVVIHWYQIDKTGSEVEYFRHVLEDAKLSDMKSYMPNTKDPRKEQFTHMEKVSVLYSKITWLYVDGNIEYTDSWVTQT